MVDSINGRPATSVQELSAGSVVSVCGHVEQGGTWASGFNGIITATVRDAEETIVCKLNNTAADGADEPFVYKDRTKTLYNGSDSIVAGAFRLTFAIPKDISYTDGTGLMTLYAINSDKTLTLHGENDSFVLTAGSGVQTDSIGPSIYCYLNAKTFTNGDKVNATPYFMAELYDDVVSMPQVVASDMTWSLSSMASYRGRIISMTISLTTLATIVVERWVSVSQNSARVSIVCASRLGMC